MWPTFQPRLCTRPPPLSSRFPELASKDGVESDCELREASSCLWLPKPITACPPFGHATQLRVFVDPDLLQYDEVWAAAGTWNDNFGAAPAEIVRVAGGVVTDLKR